MFICCKNVILLSAVMVYAAGTTHWIVTENGLIQPRELSPFNMKRTYDLMSFLDQHSRESEMLLLSQELANRKLVIDEKWSFVGDALDIESEIYKNDNYCLEAKLKLNEIDLFMSVATDGSDREDIDVSEIAVDPRYIVDSKQGVPDCKRMSDLPFSMFTFDHLPAMISRESISMKPEYGMHHLAYPESRMISFGTQITDQLRANSSSWLHYNLAVIYWRMKGVADHALECARRAVYFSPRRFRDIALLNMGAIFHLTKNPSEAVIILHAATDHAQHPVNYLALGNVYASVGDYNHSVMCYDNCLKLKKNFKQAIDNKYAILCHKKVVTRLMDLHESLQLITVDLHEFYDRRKRFLKVQEEAVKHIVHDVSSSPHGYENDQDEQTCSYDRLGCYRNDKYSTIFNTDFSSLDFGFNSHLRLTDVEAQIKKITERMEVYNKMLTESNSNIEYQIFDKDIVRLNRGNAKTFVTKDMNSKIKIKFEKVTSSETSFKIHYIPEIKKNKATPTDKSQVTICEESFTDGKHKYPSTMKLLIDDDYTTEWLTIDQCKRWKRKSVSNTKKFDPGVIFLPIENKGYNIKGLLSEKIGYLATSQHPLPWRPPHCCPEDKNLIEKSALPLKFKSKSSNVFRELPSNEFSRKMLLNYVTDGKMELAENMSDAEIGQRIVTLMELSLVPKWVTAWLASLYWVARGGPGASKNALTCALCAALTPMPWHTRDIALIPIASLMQQLNHIDIAAVVVREALSLNNNEPATNYLMSVIYHLSNKTNDAIMYMKTVIEVERNYRDGQALFLFQKWICEPKLAGLKSSSENIKNTYENEAPSATCVIRSQTKQPNNLNKVEGQKVTLAEINVVVDEEEAKIGDQNVLDMQGMLCMARITKDSAKPQTHCYFDDGEERSLKGITRKPDYRNAEKILRDEMEKRGEITSNIIEEFTFKIKVPTDQRLQMMPDITLSSFFAALIGDGPLYKISNIIGKDKLGRVHVNKDDDHKFLKCKDVTSLLKWPSNVYLRTALNNRGIDIQTEMSNYVPEHMFHKPICPKVMSKWPVAMDAERLLKMFPVLANPVDQSSIVHLADLLSELFGEPYLEPNDIAPRIAAAIVSNGMAWHFSALAALYWRWARQPESYMSCLWTTLTLAPRQHQDIPLMIMAVQLQSQGNIDDALDLAQLAFQLEPKNPWTGFLNGVLHAQKGEYEMAAKLFMYVIPLDEGMTRAREILNIALCHIKNQQLLHEEY